MVVPDIAESWGIFDDGLVYTFRLRPDVRFHNGKRVTAADFKWSLERSARSGRATNVLNDIFGAVDYMEGRADEIAGVRVVDDFILDIIIPGPKPYFLKKLAQPAAYVLDPEVVEAGGRDWWVDGAAGTGPFRLKELSGEQIVIEKNHDYYGEPAGVETIIFNLGALDDVLMYERNEIDVARVAGQNLSRLIDPNDPLNEELVVGPSAFAVRFIGFNTTMPPFDDVRFRQALNRAVDKDTVAKEVLLGGVQPAYGILPPGFPGFNPLLDGLEFNPELATQLMEGSAYADPNSRPPIVLSIPPGAQDTITGAGGRGGDVETDSGSRGGDRACRVGHVPARSAKQGAPGLHSGLAGRLSRPARPAGRAVPLRSPVNYGSYSSTDVDHILELARVEQDRANLYQQAEQTIVDDAAWVPLWSSGNQHALVKPHVKGFRLTPIIVPRLRHVTIEGRPPAQEPITQIAPSGAGASGHLLFTGMGAGQPPAQLGLDAAPGDGSPWPLLQVAGTQVVALSFVDEQRGWALQNDGTVLTTDDSGRSWRVQATNVVSCCDGDLFFLEGGTGTAVGGNGTIARTNDGGNSWTPLASGTASDIRDVYFFNGNLGWILAADSLLVTGDGGETWDQKAFARFGGLKSIFVLPSSTSYAWAGGGEGDIVLTRDGGRTWQLSGEEPGSVPPPVNIEGMFFVTPALGWAVGSAPPSDLRGPVILRSNDGGSTWQPVYEADLRSALRAVTFAPSGIGWAVGEDGLLVRFDPAEDLRALLDPDGELGRDIFVMYADGSGRTNLTNAPGGDLLPAWSPDGSRVAFTSQRTGDNEILVMGDDGTAQVNLTNHPGQDRHATWSPDGGRIAFGSNREGQFDIWVMNADGSGVTNLSSNTAFDHYPDWSPDGSRIAFHSDRTGQHDIWVMNADGSEQMDLTGDPGVDSGPAWSPDGTRIAFLSDRDGNSEIFVMSADGTEQTQLTFTDPEVENRSPAWSPDGGAVIFTSNRDGLGWNLWRMELVTGALTDLTEPYIGRSRMADWARGPATAGAVSGAQTFLEDFEGDFASRVSLPGGFEVSQDAEGNHALLATFVGHPAPAADVITVPFPGDEGYTFLLDINPLGQGNPGLALAGPDGHYKLEFDLTLDQTHILACKVVGPSDQPEWCDEAVFRPIQGEAWHTMAIIVLRDNFAVWVDGARVLDRADSDPVLREGATISPYVIGGKVLFDNIGLKGAAAGAVAAEIARPTEPAAAAPVPREPPAPAPKPAPEPETKRGFLLNTRPGEEAIPIEGLLDPVLLSIIGILATIFAALIQLVRGR